jgi:hypothetical protein
MSLTRDQANAVTGAVWLFGLTALFYTHYWWPGVMFLIGLSAIAEGLVAGRRWYAFQGGAWAIGIGVWALFNFHLAVLFVILGVSVLLGAFFRQPAFDKKPQPQVDNSLE